MALRRLFAVLLIASVLSLVPQGSANAGCSWVKTEQMVSGTLRIKWEYTCTPESHSSAEQAAATPDPPRDSDWDSVCVRTALAVGADPERFCALPPGATVAPTVTPGLAGRAFRNLSLPAAELVVQPPGGATLVNFATNFYTEQGEFTRTVRLLGQRVDLRIWPSQFGWRFGDGRSLASASAGAPYPDLEITHEYARAGGVRPSVDTTYAAEFRVNGGPWRDVDGTVTIPGSPVQLRVRTATPVLVGYH